MTSTTSWRRINVAQAQTLCQRPELVLYDVRDPGSYGQSHIERALHLTEAGLEHALFDTSKETPVLIYCYHGNASQSYAKIFADFGFKEVYDLIDGYEAWRITPMPAASQATSILPDPLNAWLVAHGFPANAPEATQGNRSTPLMLACQLGELAIVEALIGAGVAINTVNADGNNALWLACFNDNLEIIDYLVKHGVDIDHQNDNGSTSLMYAASASKDKVVERLLANGANRQVTNQDDFSALDMAASLACLNLLRQPAKA
ncbi:MAG: ankyrin repeat domain-containing protein [Methylococcaceae bacterium]|jgi:FOG: Ankyrin repeat